VDLLADAVTGLVVNVSSVSYSLPAGATALEWVVWLSANGSVPTPTVSNLALLNTTLATSGAAHIHRFLIKKSSLLSIVMSSLVLFFLFFYLLIFETRKLLR
jgi:hypothetical protein